MDDMWLTSVFNANVPPVLAQYASLIKMHLAALVHCNDKRSLQRMLQEQVGIAKMGHRQHAAVLVQSISQWQARPRDMLTESRPSAAVRAAARYIVPNPDRSAPGAPTRQPLALKPLPQADCSTREGTVAALALLRRGLPVVLRNSRLVPGADKWDLDFLTQQLQVRQRPPDGCAPCVSKAAHPLAGLSLHGSEQPRINWNIHRVSSWPAVRDLCRHRRGCFCGAHATFTVQRAVAAAGG